MVSTHDSDVAQTRFGGCFVLLGQYNLFAVTCTTDGSLLIPGSLLFGCLRPLAGKSRRCQQADRGPRTMARDVYLLLTLLVDAGIFEISGVFRFARCCPRHPRRGDDPKQDDG
eukprot:1195853-Prorocentrum_minimum.AAC.2